MTVVAGLVHDGNVWMGGDSAAIDTRPDHLGAAMTIYPTDDEKRALLEGRLRGFAYDAYGHELNRQVALAAGNAEAVQVAEQALADLAVAMATYKQELAALPVPFEPV